jgi:two-component system C4-dicarboxylate transport sensor histidine kinase DctB
MAGKILVGPNAVYAHRMKTLGQYIRGAIHEANNYLTVISGQGMLIETAADNNDMTTEKIKAAAVKIQDVTYQVSDLFQALRTLALYPDDAPPKEFSLTQFMTSIAKIAEGALKKYQIKFEMKLLPGKHMIRWNPTLFAQVLINLVNNSIEAIAETPDPWITVELSELDKVYHIDITDSGKGIPEHHYKKIFEPYITSKKSIENQGLGLTIARQILQAGGGVVNLDPVSQNTRFFIEIPKI